MKTQNLWDAAKAVLRRTFIAIQSQLKKQEKYQIDNLTLHLKQLEKVEQKTPKISRRKEIIKIQAEINDNENMTTQNVWDAAKAAKTSKREVYSNTILPQETRKTLNRQPNFTPKTTGKRRTEKSQN